MPDDKAMLNKLPALERLRRVREKLGEDDFAIAHAVTVEDVSWPELGRRLGSDHNTARRGAVAVLKRLAEVW